LEASDWTPGAETERGNPGPVVTPGPGVSDEAVRVPAAGHPFTCSIHWTLVHCAYCVSGGRAALERSEAGAEVSGFVDTGSTVPLIWLCHNHAWGSAFRLLCCFPLSLLAQERLLVSPGERGTHVSLSQVLIIPCLYHLCWQCPVSPGCLMASVCQEWIPDEEGALEHVPGLVCLMLV
jgi:hypothetical protein